MLGCGCLLAMFMGMFPRAGTILLWLARPNLFEAAFGGSWLWPLLGVIFLPFTTLMYVIMWSPTGLTGFEWMWLVLAVLLDIGHWTHMGYTNRERIPGYVAS
jgi:hypothetical protein